MHTGNVVLWKEEDLEALVQLSPAEALLVLQIAHVSVHHLTQLLQERGEQ